MSAFTKTYYKPIVGRQVVTSDEATATFVEVMVASGVINSAPTGAVINCNVYATDGTAKPSFKVKYYSTANSGVVRIDNGSSSLVAGDIINLMATFYFV